MKRHNARIIAILALYNIDINHYNTEEAMQCLNDIQTLEREYEYQVDIDYPFSHEIVKQVLDNLSEIDAIIEQSLVKYTIDRLSYVDRAIIRVATYEMLKTKTAKEVVINEALLITREYSNLDDDAQVKFNNRVLDNIAKVIYHE